MAVKPKQGSKGGFHEGHMFMVAARVYRGLPKSIYEAVQNGFDACLPETDFEIATPRIVIGVNYQTRQAYVIDNGAGADKQRIDTVLGKIGLSQKATGALGKHGLGIASLTTEGDTYTFASWARTDGRIREWTFRETDIAEQEKLFIPMRDLSTLPTLPVWLSTHLNGEFNQGWRTVVRVDKIKTDRSAQIEPEEFIQHVQARFSIVMRRLGGLVRLVHVNRRGKSTVYDINPMEIAGEQLNVVRFNSPETGLVEFDLRIAPEVKGQRHGLVIVMRTGDNTAVPIGDFSRQALSPGNRPSKALRDAMAALRSRFFAGEIRCANITLDFERGMFATGEDGVALEKLYEFVALWFSQDGWFHYELGSEEARDKRWEAAAAAGRQLAEDLLSSPEYATLVDLASLVFRSSPRRSAEPKAEDAEETSKASEQPEARESKEKSAAQPETDKPADEANDDTKARPRSGRPRRRLGMEVITMPSRASTFWTFEFPTEETPATLKINTGHRVWGQLDGEEGARSARNTRWLEELVAYLVQHVVVHLAYYSEPDEFDGRRSIIDDLVVMHAATLVKRDAVERRRPAEETDEDE